MRAHRHLKIGVVLLAETPAHYFCWHGEQLTTTTIVYSNRVAPSPLEFRRPCFTFRTRDPIKEPAGCGKLDARAITPSPEVPSPATNLHNPASPCRNQFSSVLIRFRSRHLQSASRSNAQRKRHLPAPRTLALEVCIPGLDHVPTSPADHATVNVGDHFHEVVPENAVRTANDPVQHLMAS